MPEKQTWLVRWLENGRGMQRSIRSESITVEASTDGEGRSLALQKHSETIRKFAAGYLFLNIEKLSN